MTVDYNEFAKTFSNSRKNMKWEEIEYFLSFLNSDNRGENLENNFNILDVWCWNWRFLNFFKESKIWKLNNYNYLGVDLSKNLLEEAKNRNLDNDFLELNMLNLEKINKKFKYIFFIASFHHLDNIEDRINVLKKAYDLLEEDWVIFMTNWSLNSDLNKEKYSESIVKWSENKFWSLDYNIKIWKFNRYYHSFCISELTYLFENTWFNIIENKEFENKRNFISILRK